MEGRLWALYVAALGVLSCGLCPGIPGLGPWPLLCSTKAGTGTELGLRASVLLQVRWELVL